MLYNKCSLLFQTNLLIDLNKIPFSSYFSHDEFSNAPNYKLLSRPVKYFITILPKLLMNLKLPAVSLRKRFFSTNIG